MPSEFSFDAVSEVPMHLVEEAVQAALKEIVNRFDFKDAGASIELDQKAKTISVRAKDEFKVEQALDVLVTRMAKRGLPVKNLEKGKVESALGQTAKLVVTVKSGIPTEKSKQMAADLRAAKLKVNPQIQGEQLRVTSKSKDELQSAIALLRGKSYDLELQFKNFR